MDLKKLQGSDKLIYDALNNAKSFMPKTFAKLLAMYYTDARIRKLYSYSIGLEMGDGTFANLGLKIVPNDNHICVYIGKNVSIAPNVLFLCSCDANNGNLINELDYIKKITYSGDIIVSDEVWIGAGVTIFPSVKIGACSVIGAGSIVMNDVESYSIYAGTPAKKIRDLKTGEKTNV